LLKYLLAYLKSKVFQDQIWLDDKLFKIKFVVNQDTENMTFQANIKKFDQDLNEISFKRKQGDIVKFHIFVKMVHEHLDKLK
jgi:hypothetical protein